MSQLLGLAPGIDLELSLSPLTMLARDPTIRFLPNGFERATCTPDGLGAIRVQWQTGVATVDVFGAGGSWLIDSAPSLLGLHDDPDDFRPAEGVVRRLWSRFRGDRVVRTETLWHDLAWAIIQQRVSRQEAAVQWNRFVRSFGTASPDIHGLHHPPEPIRIARLRPADLRTVGIDGQRSSTLVNAATAVARWQRQGHTPMEMTQQELLAIPGVGPWTVGLLQAITWGDPDAVIVGDAGIPSLVATALARERRADDDRMLELLEPYRPHRYRVLKLVFASRISPSKRRL